LIRTRCGSAAAAADDDDDNDDNNSNSLAKFSDRHQKRKQELEQGKTYKYLGIEESEGIQHHQMKERLKQEYGRRLRITQKSELNARNKITAIGALAVLVEMQCWYN
jgi:hypothetical protein